MQSMCRQRGCESATSLVLAHPPQSFCTSCTSCTPCSSAAPEPRGLNPMRDKTSRSPSRSNQPLSPPKSVLGQPSLGASGGRKSGTTVVLCHAVTNVPSAIAMHGRADICGLLGPSNESEKSGTNWQFSRGFVPHCFPTYNARPTPAVASRSVRKSLVPIVSLVSTPGIETRETNGTRYRSGNLHHFRPSTAYSRSEVIYVRCSGSGKATHGARRRTE